MAALLVASCSVSPDPALVEVADEAALAYQSAEAANAAAAVDAARTTKQARAYASRLWEAQLAYSDSLDTGEGYSQASAELSEVIRSGRLSVGAAKQASGRAGEAHLASWRARLAWLAAERAVVVDSEGLTSLQALQFEILIGLVVEVVKHLEERNAAELAVWEAETQLYDASGRLLGAVDAGDLAAVERRLDEGALATEAWDRAVIRWEVVDGQFVDSVARFASAQEQTMRYDVNG